jgi:hypothetical protein
MPALGILCFPLEIESTYQGARPIHQVQNSKLSLFTQTLVNRAENCGDHLQTGLAAHISRLITAAPIKSDYEVLPLQPACPHEQSMSGVSSIAAHSVLQYLPEDVSHEQTGCAHFSSFVDSINSPDMQRIADHSQDNHRRRKQWRLYYIEHLSVRQFSYKTSRVSNIETMSLARVEYLNCFALRRDTPLKELERRHLLGYCLELAIQDFKMCPQS